MPAEVRGTPPKGGNRPIADIPAAIELNIAMTDLQTLNAAFKLPSKGFGKVRLQSAIVVLSCLSLQGCGRDGGVIGKVRLGDIQGAFVIEDDERTTPLTPVRHSIYYVAKGKRSLIFEGAGGSKPELSILTSDTVLVRYCGGSIDRAASFFEGSESELSDFRLFKVQQVTSPGIAANGRLLCIS